MKKNKAFSPFLVYSICLFSCIFTYLFFRAYFNEPLHDEVATFFNYIEGGRIFEKGVIQDAQNHLLNSYLSRMMYQIFGDNFFFLRLPNVLSFILYFCGIYRLSLFLKEPAQKYILLTALSTVSFIIEYFAYSRGYGIGMSFFVWLLIYSIKWMKDQTIKNAFCIYFFAYFSVFSNLIFFGSACLACVLIVVFHFKNIRKINIRENLLLATLHLSFFLTLIPFFWFSYLLKNGGALYYGSLSGLWEVTGKSLTKNVLFYDENWQKYWLISALFGFAFTLIYQAKKNGFWFQSKEKESIFGYYLFGNIIAILILAHFFKVNYPEDRVGMYLIPLFLLMFTFLVVKSKKTTPLLFLLLFFPISFIFKLNLHTSVFSPGDRMPNEFYKKVRANITPETTFALYPLMSLTWPFQERNQKGYKINANQEYYFTPDYDIILTKKSRIRPSADLSDYYILAQDKASTFIAFKRKKAFEKLVIEEKKINTISSKAKHIKIVISEKLENLKNKKLMANVSGEINVNRSFEELRIDVEIMNNKKEKRQYSSLNQRWLLRIGRTQFRFKINTVLKELQKDDEKLFINIWNPHGRLITFKNGIAKIYELKP